MKKLTQKTRRLMSVVLAVCLLLTATVGIGATVSAETTDIQVYHSTPSAYPDGNGDFWYGASVEAGKTYTYTFQYKWVSGTGYKINANGVTLISNGTSVHEDVVVDKEINAYSYTFVASGTSVSFSINGKGYADIYFGNPTLTDSDGNSVDVSLVNWSWTSWGWDTSAKELETVSSDFFGVKDTEVLEDGKVFMLHASNADVGGTYYPDHTNTIKLDVEAGKTYTFKAYYRIDAGNGYVSLNGSAVGDKEVLLYAKQNSKIVMAEGVSYNDYTSELTYTFTAQGTTLDLYVNRYARHTVDWSPSVPPTATTYWFALPSLTDADGKTVDCGDSFYQWTKVDGRIQAVQGDVFGTEPDTGVAENGKLYGYAAHDWTNPDGGNSVFTTVTGLTAGTQYTFSCKWRYAKGNVGVRIDNVGTIGDMNEAYTVVYQDTPGEGVTYDEVTGTYSYTFTAVEASAMIGIANDSTGSMQYTYWFAQPKLVRADGFVVDVDANFDSGKWSKYLAGPEPTTLNPTLFTAVGRVGGQMVTGASIRYNEPTGLRFQSHYLGLEKLDALKEAGKIADYACGTIILPADYLVEGVELTKASLVANNVTHLDIPTTVWADDYVDGETTYKVANAVIANIKPANYGRDFTAIGYTMVTYLDGSVEYDYLDTSVTRSVSDVATALKADTETYDALSDTMKSIVDGFIVE